MCFQTEITTIIVQTIAKYLKFMVIVSAIFNALDEVQMNVRREELTHDL